MEFNFPQRKGTGIEKLLPHVTKDCIDLILKLLIYDPNDRITAEDALKHPYFKDFFEVDLVKEFHSTVSQIKHSP